MPPSAQETMEIECNDESPSMLTEFEQTAPESHESEHSDNEMPPEFFHIDQVDNTESETEYDLDLQGSTESETEQMHLQCDDESSQLITDNHMKPEYLEKIYSDSDISLCAANCAIMKFATSNNLTYKAIDDLLHLLKFLCPKPNILPSTIYKLKQFFSDYTVPYTNEKYCTKCKNKGEGKCDQPQSANIGNLVSIDIEKPLQAVLSGKMTYVASYYIFYYACSLKYGIYS